jgi:hypothetical protein
MKKSSKITTMFALLLISTASFSQATYIDPVINLVGTNFNYGSANSSLKDYKKSVLGVQVGATFQAGITKHFSLVSEFYFMSKGGKLKDNNPLNTKETTTHLYSLELPVLARFHIGPVYLNAGPSIAYNLAGTNKIDKSSKDIAFNSTSGGFKRWDAGLQGGGGFEFPFKQKRVAIDLRYNYGLTNVSYGQEAYNRSFILSIHFSKAWKTNPLAKNIN